MSYLETLLGGAEVAWKAVSEIFHLKNGYTPSKIVNEYWKDGTIPWFRMDDIRINGRILSDSIQHISASAVKGRLFPINSLIMSTTATLGEHALVQVPFLTNQQITNFSVVDFYKDKIEIKYLFYCFFDFGKWCNENANKSGGLAIIGIQKLNQYQIPIPYPNNPAKSLKVQAKIVRILDTFTELIAELNAELNARKKQYSYYRDQLLSFEAGDVEWRTLGEIGDFTYGYVAKAQDHGDARFVRITDINVNGKLIATDPKYVDLSEENEKFILKKNDLLMARTGATYGKTMIFEEDYPAIYAGFLIKLSFDEKVINPKFYWHFAQSTFFWNQANTLVSGGGQPQFNANALKVVKMPVPSLAEQARIVAILDTFDALTNSISEGLPHEIALRQQQYEYYRDLLFSFPKPAEV